MYSYEKCRFSNCSDLNASHCSSGWCYMHIGIVETYDPTLCLGIQPDQIYMAVLFWYLVKSDGSVHCRVYTEQVTFLRYQEHMAIYKWSPCIIINIKNNTLLWLLPPSTSCIYFLYFFCFFTLLVKVMYPHKKFKKDYLDFL